MVEGFTLKKTAVLAAIAVIVGVITMGSGYIAKMMTRANACHQTKMMLFLAGLITALIIAALGAMYSKFVSKEKQDEWQKYVEEKVWAEQFRYGPAEALQATKSEYYRYADDQKNLGSGGY